MGAMVVARNTSDFLHELGHGTAAVTLDGKIRYIEVRALGWSRCGSSIPAAMLWGGAVLGSAGCLMLLILLWRLRSAWWFGLLLAGALGLVSNGGYVLITALHGQAGDGASLRAQGTSWVTIFLVCVPLVLAGVALVLRLLPLIGLNAKDGFLRRLGVFALADVPVRTATLVMATRAHPDEQSLWAAMLLPAVGGYILVAALTAWTRRRTEHQAQQSVPWGAVAVHLAAAGLIVWATTPVWRWTLS